MSAPKLVINFVNPNPLPANGFKVLYRPKDSLQAYYTYTQLTGTPATILANILANVDYEGTIESICTGESSKTRPFKTSNYPNAIGNIIIADCDLNFVDGLTAVTFNGQGLLPLGENFPLEPAKATGFISNVKGTYTLILTHDFEAGTIKITDSEGVIQEQDIDGVTNTFTNVTINSTANFKIEIGC